MPKIRTRFMVKLLAAALAAVLALSSGTSALALSPSKPETTKEIKFTDDGFEAMVRKALKKTSGAVTETDLEKLYADVHDMEIQKLLFNSGLDMFTYNRLLYIIGGQIVRNASEIKTAKESAAKSGDLAELSLADTVYFTDMQLIFVETAEIDGLEPLLELEELVYLHLSDCNVPEDQTAALEKAGVTVMESGGEGFVKFTSPEFENMVRVALEKESGGITEEELQSLCILENDMKILMIAFGRIISEANYDSAMSELENEVIDLFFASTGAEDLDELDEMFGDTDERELQKMLVSMLPELDLTDIGLFGDIQGLALTYNVVTDFSPLLEAPSLTVVALDHMQCGDLSPALSLPNLEYFYGQYLYMTEDGLELKPEGSESLTEIILVDTDITDFSGLGCFPNLTNINLSQNRITDIKTLSWLYELENLSSIELDNTFLPWAYVEYLDNTLLETLGNWPIQYYTLFAEFADEAFLARVREALEIPEGDIDADFLDALFAEDDFIEEVMDDENWLYCYNLMLFMGEIVRNGDEFDAALEVFMEDGAGLDEDELLTVPFNTENLAYIPYLSGAIILAAEIDDITPLINMSNIEMLYFEASVVPDLGKLFDMKWLSTLTVISCQLTGDLWAASSPEDSWIDTITISGCGLTDVTPLQNLPYLYRLNISYNDISDITPLLNMTGLEYLDVTGNPISEADMEKLRKALPDTEIVAGDGVGFASGVNMVVFDNEDFEQMVLDALGMDEGPVSIEDLASLYVDMSIINEVMDSPGPGFAEDDKVLLIIAGKIITKIDEFYDVLEWMSELTSDYEEFSEVLSVIPAINLDGVGMFDDMDTLCVMFSNIEDISPIKDISGLSGLLLAYDGIKDFSPAFEISSLKTVFAGEIYEDDGKTVTKIFPKNVKCTDLEYLTLHNMGIDDISALGVMTKLIALELDYNNISDLTPLAGMKNLRSVNLGNNRVSDITPLLKLTDLENLYIEYNRISDDDLELLEEKLPNTYISSFGQTSPEEHTVGDVSFDIPFSAMVKEALGTDDIEIDKLDELYCDTEDDLFWEIIDYQEMTGEDISHMLVIIGDVIVRNSEDFIAASAKLEDIDYELVEIDLNNLLAFEDLDFLFMYGCSALNADVLQGHENLAAVNISYGKVSDATALFSVPNIRYLLMENIVVTYDAPRHTPEESSLEWLYCNLVEGLESLPHFDKLTNLWYLGMLNCGVMDVKQLKSLTQLEYLVLNGNSVADIKPLTGMKDLVFLSMSNNIVTDFTPLSELDSLITLLLDYSLITSLDFLEGMNQLQELSLYSNKISDISPLLKLDNLTYLDLEENSVSEEDYNKLVEHFPDCSIWWY